LGALSVLYEELFEEGDCYITLFVFVVKSRKRKMVLLSLYRAFLLLFIATPCQLLTLTRHTLKEGKHHPPRILPLTLSTSTTMGKLPDHQTRAKMTIRVHEPVYLCHATI